MEKIYNYEMIGNYSIPPRIKYIKSRLHQEEFIPLLTNRRLLFLKPTSEQKLWSYWPFVELFRFKTFIFGSASFLKANPNFEADETTLNNLKSHSPSYLEFFFENIHNIHNIKGNRLGDRLCFTVTLTTKEKYDFRFDGNHDDTNLLWRALDKIWERLFDIKKIDELCLLLNEDNHYNYLLEIENSLKRRFNEANPNVIEHLTSCLTDSNIQVKTPIIEALGASKNPLSIPPLYNLLIEAADSSISSASAEALGKMGEAGAECLISALRSENSEVRFYAALGLRHAKTSSVIEPLIEALKDEVTDVRIMAAKALVNKRDRRCVEPLIYALQDKDSLVSKWAAEALGNCGNSMAIEPLTKILNHKDSLVKQAVREALKKLQK